MNTWFVEYTAILLEVEPPEMLPTIMAAGLLSWLKEYEYVVTTCIAVFAAICAAVGLFAVRENLQTDRIRFRRLSHESKEILKVLVESRWRDFVSVIYYEMTRYMVLQVRYRNDDPNLPFPAGLKVSSHFHFALMELVEKGLMERQERRFYLTNKGNRFLEKFEGNLKKQLFHSDTCFENDYAVAKANANRR